MSNTNANTNTNTNAGNVDAVVENHIAKALKALGIVLEDENFEGTPKRFVRYLKEYLVEYDPQQILRTGFNDIYSEAGYKGMIVQTNIPFSTVCPHHLLPVTGECCIGYIPGKNLVGLSKLTRLVRAVGHSKPRMQEECTDIIANDLMQHLSAKGVIVVISAYHGCMSGRGVQVQAPTITSTVRGLFRDVIAAREEFFSLVSIHSDSKR